MSKHEEPPPRHVMPHPKGWQEKKEGSDRAARVYDTKTEAVKETKEHAKDEGGRMIVHDKHNQIQEERTYREDPYPPPG